MATRQYCDRCNEEITGMSYVIVANARDRFDLCPTCKKKFDAFLKGADFTEGASQ